MIDLKKRYYVFSTSMCKGVLSTIDDVRDSIKSAVVDEYRSMEDKDMSLQDYLEERVIDTLVDGIRVKTFYPAFSIVRLYGDIFYHYDTDGNVTFLGEAEDALEHILIKYGGKDD